MSKPLLRYRILHREQIENGERVSISLDIEPHLNGFASCHLTMDVPAVERIEESEPIEETPKAKGKGKKKAEAVPVAGSVRVDSSKRDAEIRRRVAQKANAEVWGVQPQHGAPLWTPDEVQEHEA